MAIRFGEFVLDPQRRQLFRGEEAVHLTPKAFELFGLLLELQEAPGIPKREADHLARR